jgi:hypothetical protein
MNRASLSNLLEAIWLLHYPTGQPRNREKPAVSPDLKFRMQRRNYLSVTGFGRPALPIIATALLTLNVSALHPVTDGV